MKCEENGQKPELVKVYWLDTPSHGLELVCDLDLFSRHPLKPIHDNLDDVSWAVALPARRAQQ